MMKLKFTHKQFIDALLHYPKFNEKDFELICAFYKKPDYTLSLSEIRNLFAKEADIQLRRRVGSIGSKLLKYHKIDYYKEISLFKFCNYDAYCSKIFTAGKEEAWKLHPEMIKGLKELCNILSEQKGNYKNILLMKAYQRLQSIIAINNC